MKDIIKKIIIGVVLLVVVIGVVFTVIKDDEPAVDNPLLPGTSQTGELQVQGNKTTKPADNVNVDATTGNNGGNNTTDKQGVTGSQNQSDVQQNTLTQNQQGDTPTQGQQNTPTQNQQGDAPIQGQQNTPTQNQQGDAPTQGQQNTTTQNQQGGDVVTTNPAVPDNQINTTNPAVPVDPQNPQPVNKIDVYQNMFRSGKFIMKVNDAELGLVTMAMSGNKMYLEASMEGLALKMIYDGDKPDEQNPETGTWFMVVDKVKKYSPMPADMLGDMNVEELTKDFAKGDSTTVYTKSTENVNGEELYCESCVDENGNTTKYYFRGDQLVRSDSINPAGEISTTEFQEISADVDESIFAIPEGYAKLNISWLFNMMG